MARVRKGRPLNGVLLLDKPAGMTSNAALQKVRRLFGAQKAGHTGSLDPLATGVLPICFGEATKFSNFLLDADKGYYTTAKLGDTRNTGDSDGEQVACHPVPDLNESILLPVLDKFKGDIQQVPSMYSALKHQGKPLYEYARKGITIERPARAIKIHRLELDAIRGDELDLTVECSKGTYIRSLVEDIGSELGCGAHVSMLRRFKAGHFSLADSMTLEALESQAETALNSGGRQEIDAHLMPTDCLLPDLEKVCANNELARSILHGQAVRIADFKKMGLARLYVSQRESADDLFAGVVEVLDDGWIQPKRLVNLDLDLVC